MCFGAIEYGSEKDNWKSVVMVSWQKNGTIVVRMAKFLLLLKMSARNGSEPAYFALSRVIYSTEPLDK